jgi:hypothetical protein
MIYSGRADLVDVFKLLYSEIIFAISKRWKSITI